MAQLVDETTKSLDELREAQTKSDFEQLIFANLPHGDVRLVQTKKYKVTTDQETTEINRLKKDVLENVKDGPNFTWADTKKLNTNFQKGAAFDLDMYLRLDKMESSLSQDEINVAALLGTAGERLQLVASTKADPQAFLATPITDTTRLWVEICTDPLLARYKLYQLLRAHTVLKPPQDEAIMAVVCLNGEWDDTARVASFLHENPFVQKQVKDRGMELAIAWTKHRNLHASMLRVEHGLEVLRTDLKAVQGNVEVLTTDLKAVRTDLKAHQDEVRTDFKALQGDLKEVKAILSQNFGQSKNKED